MDFVYDYISVNTFWTILFIIHALLAVALLGALTHQAMSVLMPVRQAAGPAGFVTRFRLGARRELRHGGLRAVDRHLHLRRLDLHQVPHLRPHPDRAGRVLEDARRVRDEGAPCDHRARAAADLLVLLEERARSGIRQRAQMADRDARGHVLVYFLTGHVVNNVRGFGS